MLLICEKGFAYWTVQLCKQVRSQVLVDSTFTYHHVKKNLVNVKILIFPVKFR